MHFHGQRSFELARKQFLQLHNSEKFGRRGGFSGFTVDALASQKTKQVQRYMSRGGLGVSSMGISGWRSWRGRRISMYAPHWAM